MDARVALLRIARVVDSIASAAVVLNSLLWLSVFVFLAIDALQPHSIFQSDPAAARASPVGQRIGESIVYLAFAMIGFPVPVSHWRT